MGKRDLRTTKRPWCLLPLPVSALCQVFLILYIIELHIHHRASYLAKVFSNLFETCFVKICLKLSKFVFFVNICLYIVKTSFLSIFVKVLSLFVKICLYLSICCQNLFLFVFICLIFVFICLCLFYIVKICQHLAGPAHKLTGI